MSIRIGYLLPTRERVMAGQPQAMPLLELAERAERLGFNSVWARAMILLPALRNPVLLAHQVATLDQLAEGRLILGVRLDRHSKPAGCASQQLVGHNIVRDKR
jgi:alkanesulfonate monooxygenase SsuD/methylene tetrahydromethanopterin reductase-like flavin-dependent oxidoreductase (luciferase family)